MKIVYICSPYRAKDEETLKRNIEYARELTRAVLLRGDVPVTVHLYMTQCLSEEMPEERKIGLAAGLELIKRCDELLVGRRFGISEGMSGEIERGEERGIRICFHD